MEKILKILMLEDSATDAALIHRQITKAGIKFTSMVVNSRDEFLNGLNSFQPDLVLSDHSLPKFNFEEALKLFKEHQKAKEHAAPFILVTGAHLEQVAVNEFLKGTDDYIFKDRMERLPAAILAALKKCGIQNEHNQIIKKKLALLERYECVFKNMQAAVWEWDIEHLSNFCGEGFEHLFGHVAPPGAKNNILNTAYISIEDIERVTTGIQHSIDGNNSKWNDNYKYLKANGDYALVEDNAVIIRDNNGKALRMVGAMQDITSKRIEEWRLKQFELVISHTNDAVMIAAINSLDPIALRSVYVNEAFTKLFGYAQADLNQGGAEKLHADEGNAAVWALIKTAFENDESCQADMIGIKKNGEKFWSNIAVATMADTDADLLYAVFIERDITQAKVYTSSLEEQNIQLKEAAAIQQQKIKNTFSNWMKFIHSVDNNNIDKIENVDMINFLTDAAGELDAIISTAAIKTNNPIINNSNR